MRKREAFLQSIFTCFLCTGLLAPAMVNAAGPDRSTGPDPAAQNYFTDVILVNQDGEEMRLYSDLMKDRVVILGSFFTSCNGACPVLAGKFEQFQEILGDHLGEDAYLISISVDPETDTPERLKEYAERFHARPGWYFLTGKKENVETALHKFGQLVEVQENHLNVMLIGNLRTGLWKKAFGLASTGDLVKLVEEVMNDG